MDWILRVELDGEWEQCRFRTRRQALQAFAAISADYKRVLARAVMFPVAALFQAKDDKQKLPRRAYVH